MNKVSKLLCICICISTFLMKNAVYAIPKVIFDTDIARVDSNGSDRSDIDDLGALAILNALSNKQLCEILGIVTNSRSNKIVEMIDAVNIYYNNPGIPIGLKEGNRNLIEQGNSYARYISSIFKYSQHSFDAPSSTELLRKVLSEISEDDTVIYIHADAISTWDYLCVSSFLESGPDDISQLTGYELFNSKVDKFISYIPCLPNNNVSENCPDWCDNPTTDVSKLQYFIDNFRNDLIGNATAVEEGNLPTKLWEQSDDNPVKIAYQYYYTETPPPWYHSTKIPNSISIYGDGLGIIYLLTNNSTNHLFSRINKGSFVIDMNNKLRWSDKYKRRNHSYFYTIPTQRNELWKLIDELICFKPK